MTVGSDRKVCGMQESRLELRCTIKTVKSESNVYPKHKMKRVELGSVVITVEYEHIKIGEESSHAPLQLFRMEAKNVKCMA